MITFAIYGIEGFNPALGFGPLQAEFERRGFPCRLVGIPNLKTQTPNRDRAQIMIEALRDVEGELALLGISNHGLFLPLVAAARPVRRIVLINAVIPHPGQSFLKASRHERVFSNIYTRFMAAIAPGMTEVCPLTELPQVEYVYISAEKDDAIRPQWEQWAAREYLHVEPVIIKGAGHANIIHLCMNEIVDAATKGLKPTSV
jgi:hypothetical protein